MAFLEPSRSPSETLHFAPGQVLVVDTRSSVATIARHLESVCGNEVTVVATANEALAEFVGHQWDLLLVDPRLEPQRLQSLVRHARSHTPQIAIASLVENQYVADRVADDLFIHLVNLDGTELEVLLPLSRLIDRVHAARHRTVERVLAIGAHPDDVEIGVGGSLLAHKAAGHDINILTMSRGARGGDTARREGESRDAAGILGARLFLEDLDDTEIPDGLPTVQLIERVIKLVRPTTIYTHSVNDTHQDHRAVHRATLIAARRVDRVACYQSPSATIGFHPNRFVPVDDYVHQKLRAIAAFASQTAKCDYLRPDALTATTRYWARFAGGDHAEAFEVVRDATSFHPHPAMPFTPHTNNKESAYVTH